MNFKIDKFVFLKNGMIYKQTVQAVTFRINDYL